MAEDINIDYLYLFMLHLVTGHKIWTNNRKLIKIAKVKNYGIFITTAQLKEKIELETVEKASEKAEEIYYDPETGKRISKTGWGIRQYWKKEGKAEILDMKAVLK